MKKCIIPFLLSLVLFSSMLFGDIRFSHHDFSGSSWSSGEICRPCHTPHNASTDVPNSPLWNHQTTTASFSVYESSTLNSFPGQPNGRSKLCLSCHDGTVAIENHGGYTGGTRYAGVGNLTTDLTNDHPISLDYNSAVATADGGLHDPSITLSGLGSTIEQDMLFNGKLECPTCHDVHVARNTQGCSGCHNVHGSFGITKTLSLRISNDGSALCLTCHQK